MRVVGQKRPAGGHRRGDRQPPDDGARGFFRGFWKFFHERGLVRTKIRDYKYTNLVSRICQRRFYQPANEDAMLEVLRINLCSPLSLAFVLGIVSRLVRSELSIPRELYASLSIYLLLALGLKGGVELSHSTLSDLYWPVLVTLGIGIITPITSYLVLRRIGKFSTADAAGIAAHYGSVSAVTFIAAQQFVQTLNYPAEGFMPTLVTLMESPGIQIALAIGAIQTAKQAAARAANSEGPSPPARPTSAVLHEVLTGRSMILMVGGLIVGLLMGAKSYEPVKPFFEGMFKGALTLFLLEMGLAAGSRLGDLKTVGLPLSATMVDRFCRSCLTRTRASVSSMFFPTQALIK